MAAVVNFDHLVGDVDALIAVKNLVALQDQGKFVGFPDLIDDLFQLFEDVPG